MNLDEFRLNMAVAQVRHEESWKSKQSSYTSYVFCLINW